jgi:ABC-type amino acid transport substrate-binding protein
MRRIFLITAVTTVLIGIAHDGRAQLRPIELAVPPNRPVVDLEGGKLTGFLGDIADQALKRAGFQPTYTAMPFGRLYPTLAARQIDGALSVFGTPERQRTAWYSTPIVTEYSVLIVPKGRSFPFARASDAGGKTIGTQTGFAYPGFDGTPGVTFQPTPDRANNLRLVALGRIDAAITGSITGLYQARGLNLLDQMEVLPVAISAITLSIALNNERFAPADFARVDEALRQLLAGPEFAASLAAAGVGDLVKRFETLQ